MNRAHVTCYRDWARTSILPTGDAPRITGLSNSITGTQHFSFDGDEYVSIFFKSDRERLAADSVQTRIGYYGARPAIVESTAGGGWVAICKVPLGLPEGKHAVKLWVEGGAESNSVYLVIGESQASASLEPMEEPLVIELVADGLTWERDRVSRSSGCFSIWVRGLPESATDASVGASLNGVPAKVTFLSESDTSGLRQVNVALEKCTSGPSLVVLKYAAWSSEPKDLEIID